MKHREFMSLAIRAASWLGEGPDRERVHELDDAGHESLSFRTSEVYGLVYFAALMAFILEARACMLAERYETCFGHDTKVRFTCCHAYSDCQETATHGVFCKEHLPKP